jgi:DNA-binding response OmpR family regulator
VVAREELLSRVWGVGPKAAVETRTVDMHVARLRDKLKDAKGSILVTVRGRGYRFGGEGP